MPGGYGCYEATAVLKKQKQKTPTIKKKQKQKNTLVMLKEFAFGKI